MDRRARHARQTVWTLLHQCLRCSILESTKIGSGHRQRRRPHRRARQPFVTADPRNQLRRCSRLIGALGASLIAASAFAQAPSDTTLVRRDIMRQAHLTDSTAVDGIDITRKQSVIIPGLTYTLGTYRPPATADVLIFAVGARRNGSAVVVQNVDDWAHVVGRWDPASASEAIRACIEVADVAGPRRDPFRTSVLLTTSTKTASADTAGLSSLRLEPEARRDSSGVWRIRFSLLQPGVAVEYRCMLHLPDSVRLDATRVIENAGLLPFTP